MRTNDRLLRLLHRRDLAGGWNATAVTADQPDSSIGDAKLFAMTFAAGFLFTAIFIA